ncbi:hypothetical protein HYPSUDRAFT_920174 [Hypholoma sublateritium FD-334 SS-4]|uniref:Uncharacterized protein n=1 Tax=Hypholoma sublateritium (strain FD-334 SS-4) TaxID=945553 RepID=A0A0D2M6D3_HYPSF|nr:hypothetical protein HYPSUDRAFT_920174 [Hypholoma sublateritium FD-334 SS-4]
MHTNSTPRTPGPARRSASRSGDAGAQYAHCTHTYLPTYLPTCPISVHLRRPYLLFTSPSPSPFHVPISIFTSICLSICGARISRPLPYFISISVYASPTSPYMHPHRRTIHTHTRTHMHMMPIPTFSDTHHGINLIILICTPSAHRAQPVRFCISRRSSRYSSVIPALR